MGMRGVALIAALATTSSACSFLFMKTPPSDIPEGKYASCDEGFTYPLLDMFFALSYAAALVEFATGDEEESSATSEQTGGITGFALLTAMWGVSSWYGFSRAGRCRDHHSEYRAWRAANPVPVAEEEPVWKRPIGRPGDAYPGREANVCRLDGSCDPGLVCASNICVRPPDPPPAAPPGAP